jgi:hypothetical protein
MVKKSVKPACRSENPCFDKKKPEAGQPPQALINHLELFTDHYFGI